MNDITQKLMAHYGACFQKYGATPKGVDWRDQTTADLRYEKMLDVARNRAVGNRVPGLLDVGCGYGGLLAYAQSRGFEFNYVGIDIVPDMINEAQRRFPNARFICADVMTTDIDQAMEYVVCNGILTQKLDISVREMDAFSKLLIHRLFGMATKGIAFNIMTSFVTFMAPNLFYKNPIEMLAYCLTTLSAKVSLDHSYELYEYTTYVYHD
jgi:SAM-dependent methyltransferase